MPDVRMRSLCAWGDLNEWGSVAGWAKHPWSSAGLLEFQLIHTSDSASLFLIEGKSRTFIALNCVLGTVMSSPRAHMTVELQHSA